MTPTVQQEIARDLPQAINLMVPLVAEGVKSSRPVCRLEVEFKQADPLAWLAGQAVGQRVFWSGRDGRFVAAGVGIADLVEGDDPVDFVSLYKRLSKSLSKGPNGLRYYGGSSFNLKSPSAAEWSGFGSGSFVLPRFEVSRVDSRSILACNLLPHQDSDNLESILTELTSLSPVPGAEPDEIPGFQSRTDLPGRDGWTTMVSAALEEIRDNGLEKVVLARRSRFSFENKLNPMAVLDRLSKAAPACYHFCFERGGDTAFVGASPERLYDRYGATIGCDAMAGTRARGDTLEDDLRKAGELIGSEKEIREHRYVTDGVYESLSPLCESLERNGDPVLVKLARVQHLVARLEGVLRQGVDDGAILDSIHPTAAVGGFPRRLSVERIEQLEPFDRGWYAGPVGWIGRDGAEFAVAIRSGLISNNVIDLYSGAGIVEGSTPDSEWKEIDNKIANFLKALRVDEA